MIFLFTSFPKKDIEKWMLFTGEKGVGGIVISAGKTNSTIRNSESRICRGFAAMQVKSFLAFYLRFFFSFVAAR